MFVFQASRYLAELGAFAPDMLEASRAAFEAAKTDLDFVRIDKAAFEACRAISIDYAVMEKTRDAVVLPLDAGWSDVGSWSSLFDALPADEEGNVLQGDVLVHDTHDCYVHSTSRLVAAVGMDDHIIVETKDAVLVAPKERVQDVKELVAKLKKSGRSESRAAPRGVQALGQLRQSRQRGALPGQAPVGQAGRRAVAADAPPPRRALDRGAGHGADHLRREDVPAVGERVDLHSDRRHASHRESRARWPCTSSRCSPAPISARTTSCASRTITAAKGPALEPDHLLQGLRSARPDSRRAERRRRLPRRARLCRSSCRPNGWWSGATSGCRAPGSPMRCAAA